MFYNDIKKCKQVFRRKSSRESFTYKIDVTRKFIVLNVSNSKLEDGDIL